MRNTVAAGVAVSVRPVLDPIEGGREGLRAWIVRREPSAFSRQFRRDFLYL
jgi:hypothetical protein